MRKVLVTGVSGFLGGYVASQFGADGWQVLGVDSASSGVPSSSDAFRFFPMQLPSGELGRLLQREQPAALIHCAGSASVGGSMVEPLLDFGGNVGLTIEVLNALRLYAPNCAFLLLSSAAVYGNPLKLPIVETDATEPLSPYGFHKRIAEQGCLEFAKIYGLRTASARIFSAYGPRLRRQVVWDICAKAIQTGEVRLRGTGTETRDFIHAKDVARGLGVILESGQMNGEVYNLSSGHEVSISELARLILGALGLVSEVQFDGLETPGVPLNWRADTRKIRNLGFEPAVQLETGLLEVAAWCRAELGESSAGP